MEGDFPLHWVLAGAGLLLLWLGIRGLRRRHVISMGGQVRQAGEPAYYLILTGYWAAAILLLLMAATQFHRLYGWGTLVLYLLGCVAAGLTLNWLARRLRRGRERLRERLRRGPAPPKTPPPPAATPAPASAAAATPSAPRRWVLAAGALLAEVEGWDHQILAGGPLTRGRRRQARKLLRRTWDIRRGGDFDEVQQWLLETGHRHEFHELITRVAAFSPEEVSAYLTQVDAGAFDLDTPEEQAEARHRVAMIRENRYDIRHLSFMAWDYLRFIHLHRLGYLAGYQDEATTWSRLLAAGQVLRSRYDSWDRLHQSYLAAREFWSIIETQREEDRFRQAIARLQADPKSPWQAESWAG